MPSSSANVVPNSRCAHARIGASLLPVSAMDRSSSSLAESVAPSNRSTRANSFNARMRSGSFDGLLEDRDRIASARRGRHRGRPPSKPRSRVPDVRRPTPSSDRVGDRPHPHGGANAGRPRPGPPPGTAERRSCASGLPARDPADAGRGRAVPRPTPAALWRRPASRYANTSEAWSRERASGSRSCSRSSRSRRLSSRKIAYRRSPSASRHRALPATASTHSIAGSAPSRSSASWW